MFKYDSLGPGTYTLNVPPMGPITSFGTRFNSSIRNKEHLRPVKKDGPGPGAYKLPNSVQVKTRHPASVNRTTFGTSGRQFS